MILLALPHLKKHLGVTKQAVAYLANKTIKDAVVFRDKSKYIDISHTLFKNYYKTKEQSLKQSYSEFVEACKPDCIILETSGAVEQQGQQTHKSNLDNISIYTKKKIDAVGHLTLKEIIQQFGSTHEFSHEMQCLKEVLEVQKLTNQVHKQRGQLIDVDVLDKIITGYIDTLADLILNDGMNYACQQMALLTDASKQKQILFIDKVQAEYSRFIKTTKTKIKKVIEDAKSK
jgi:hypothetical protein